MNQLYELVEITKQSHLASMQRWSEQEDKFLLLSAVLKTERTKHPAMALKKLYVKLKPDFTGRDAFVEFGMTNGFEPVRKTKFHKTTHSGEERAFPSLLHDLIVNVFATKAHSQARGKSLCSYLLLVNSPDLANSGEFGFL